MKFTAIIQARMGSNRLPGKVLFPLGTGSNCKPALIHLIERVKRSKQINDILLVTTDNTEDEILMDIAERYGCLTFAGESKYVLDNIITACEIYGVEVIVDVTADCPCIDPGHIDKMIKFFKNQIDFSYIANVINRTFPRGFDLQVYMLDTLKKFAKQIKDKNHRNHSGWNIMKRESMDRMMNFSYPINHSDWRLCIDEEADYKLMQIVFNHFKNNKFSTKDVIDFLEDEFWWVNINKEVKQKNPGSDK
jgi:spore coat polysaccharide biosynthesis protein SpsF